MSGPDDDSNDSDEDSDEGLDVEDDMGPAPAAAVAVEDEDEFGTPRAPKSPRKLKLPSGSSGSSGSSKRTEEKMAQVIDLGRRAFGRYTRLRQAAAVAYITDPDDPTLEKLSADSRFSKITPQTLAKWCAQDGWVNQRVEFLTTWKSKTLQRLATPISLGLRAELRTLETIADRNMAWLQHPLVMPASYGEVVKAQMAVDKRREELRDRLAALSAETDGPVEEVSPLTVDEEEVARKAAHAILESRRVASAGQLALPATAAEPDE